MNIPRMIAMVLIFALACAGWAVLGASTLRRAGLFPERLEEDVCALWGGPIVQPAPTVTPRGKSDGDATGSIPVRNEVFVQLELEHRKKGLVWYPTYTCDFSGTYQVANPGTENLEVLVHFAFPITGATYDRFSFQVDGQKISIPVNTQEGIQHPMDIGPGQSRTFGITYRTRGLREWRYQPARAEAARVRGLDVRVRTDFAQIDFPEGALSPMDMRADAGGMLLTWTAEDLITTQDLGVTMPEKINPGPLSGRITYFAPVSLFFIFLLVATITVLRSIPIHPMHYLFVAAGTFSFHILFAYLVDLVDLHRSFLLASLTAVFLVTWYLRMTMGPRFPWWIAFVGQLFYLVLFSYSFFLKGMTGLTVTIGSVGTLAVLMKMTAGTDWNRVFVRGARPPGG